MKKVFVLNNSIKIQYPVIFGLLLFISILLVSFLNFVSLGRFYLYHKEQVLINSYKQIDRVAGSGNIESDSFDTALKTTSSINNIDVLILDSNAETIKSTDLNPKMMTSRLLEYIFSGTDDAETLYKDGKIQIQKIHDYKVGLDYLELWGVLSDDNLILMRTPVQSIQEATSIANRVLVICGTIIALLGFIVIWTVSNKLTKPIMNLVEISEKMTRLDFSEKYCKGKGNEIDELGEHINSLSENLEKTIGELKKANIELKKDIEQKNELDEMRKEFISNVSHELKTPIALIQGYAEGLKDCVADDEESREFYCDVIIDEASRMNKLVRGLLDLTQLEFGNDRVEIAHFNIVELIINCVASFDIMIKNDNIKIYMPDPSTEVFVWSDEFKIQQIMTNYLSNAIHYVKGNEKIIKIFMEKKDNLLRVSVYNSGDPIPENIIPNLWDKFYKADKARTREYGGSGIGLSIVKASMEAMGRDYGVINHNDGVEFWFEVDANDTIRS